MNDKRLWVLLLVSCLGLIGCQSSVKQSVRAETIESVVTQQEASQVVKQSTVQSSRINNHTRESKVLEETASKEESTSRSESVEFTATESSEAAISESTTPVTVIQPPSNSEKVEENYQFSVTKNQRTEEFIQVIGTDAQQIAWDNGLYASVMIVQAILETGSGNSQLAQPPYHNLFGIKGSYQGKQVTFPTKEDKGDGQLYTIQSAFRQYPSYKESLADYAELLKRGLSGNPSFYRGTWREYATTYQEATETLTGKYATDTSYDKKLNALIGTYALTRFDQEPEQVVSLEDDHSEVVEEEQKTEEPTTETMDVKEESYVVMTETKQPVVRVSPITQRPAKQVAGKQIVE